MGSTLTVDDVMADLDAGRSAPLTIHGPLAPPRPRLGDPTFRHAVAEARAAVALHLPAGALLERLWFTPWAAGRARRRPEGAHPFEVPTAAGPLVGWEVGSGPTVLAVHGWGGASTDLAVMAGRLAAAGRRVVAVDLPAHGASPGQRTDLFEFARAVAALGERAGPLDGVVAHSLGSVATLLAVADGLDVPRAALVAPPATLAGAVARFCRALGLGDRGEALLRSRIEAAFGHDVWQRLDVATTAPLVDSDVLVVHDVDDREVPVADGVRVARALGTEPVLTTGLGHGRILADDAVARHVLGHLAS